jgi:putative hydrolase of HD superfamily
VHDLAEAEVGDIPYFETSARKDAKAAAERAAMDRFVERLPSPEGATVRDLWLEFEEGRTPEARFARALDHLEVQVQHNLADFATWEPVEHDLVYTKMDDRCAHDPLLQALCAGIRARAETKMREGGVDVETLRGRHGLPQDAGVDARAPQSRSRDRV